MRRLSSVRLIWMSRRSLSDGEVSKVKRVFKTNAFWPIPFSHWCNGEAIINVLTKKRRQWTIAFFMIWTFGKGSFGNICLQFSGLKSDCFKQILKYLCNIFQIKNTLYFRINIMFDSVFASLEDNLCSRRTP